jgi:hypothetical protein
MKRLGIPNAYLGERMGWIRFTMKRCHSRYSPGKTKSGSTAHTWAGGACNFDVFVRHGKGGVGTFGTDVNALVKQSVGFDADLYVGGHTHRQWFVKVPHLYCGRFDVKQRFVGYARAGSLLRGFLYGEPTYAEISEYNPLSIGWPEVYVYFSRNAGKNLNISDMKGLT